MSAAAAGWLPEEGCTVQVNVADCPSLRELIEGGLGAPAVQPAGRLSDGVSWVARPRLVGTETVAVAVKAVPGCAVSGTWRFTFTPGAAGMAYVSLKTTTSRLQTRLLKCTGGEPPSPGDRVRWI